MGRLRSTLVALLWNGRESRPRAGWRLVGQTVLFLVLLAVVGGAVAAVRSLALAGSLGVSPGLARVAGTVGVQSAAGTAAVASVWLAGRTLDRRPLAAFGLDIDREWAVDLGFGLALGAGLMTGIFLLELAAGWVVVTGTIRPWAGVSAPLSLAAGLALFCWVGVYEELLSRGYHLANAAEGLCGLGGIGPRGALGAATAFSAGLFGVVHAANPNATATSVLSIGAAGVMLALGRVLTGDLAIPIGVHVTWNVFQGLVYGFPVSGADVGASLLVVEQRGDPLVTGGAFGPEAGLVGVAAVVAGSLATVGWVRYRYGRLELATALARYESGDG